MPEPAAAPVLRVEDLTVRFPGVPAAVVDGVGFAVGRGRTLAIVGESGCGKSVTSLALMGLLPPAARVSGRALFAAAGGGVDLLSMPPRARADLRGNRVAMVFQEPMTSLNPAFTVGDQIAEAVVRHRGVTRAQGLARAREVLDLVRIPAAAERLRAYPHELSGGMRQRAMIAMALSNDPELLIADEPTTALDVTIQAQILSLIAQLQKDTGAAMILVTHDLGVVAEVADDVAVMYAGRAVEAGPVTDIFDDPQHPYTIGLMGSMPALGRRTGRLATIPGAVPLPADLPPGCRFATRCPFADARCAAERPPERAFGPAHRAACWHAPLESLGAAA
ncbi:ABC transporter ATP-binding protein [Lichenibacterium minor]|uniref:ABC transporter ATP-binding protein n=1 Tax=Lichenibacterium minor TaxID=2316528 RepID=A0A4Q2U300_9HYPH|nr:ABC transporter ATP-binding protein [Lichenibacterium minor]RYC30722.1 ABC transporter ATP-binding protein [Lichenibacterium minor]